MGNDMPIQELTATQVRGMGLKQVNKTNPVGEAFDYTGSQLATLIDLLQTLEARLSPVLGAELPPNEAKDPAGVSNTISSKVAAIGNAVNSQNRKIREILDRLEI